MRRRLERRLAGTRETLSRGLFFGVVARERTSCARSLLHLSTVRRACVAQDLARAARSARAARARTALDLSHGCDSRERVGSPPCSRSRSAGGGKRPFRRQARAFEKRGGSNPLRRSESFCAPAGASRMVYPVRVRFTSRCVASSSAARRGATSSTPTSTRSGCATGRRAHERDVSMSRLEGTPRRRLPVAFR